MRYDILHTIDIETGETIERISFEYDGPVALAKKGRKTMEKVATENLAIAQKEQAERERQRALSEPLVSELESETGPGRISRYAAAQLASERDNIARTFEGLRTTAMRSLGARGLAPDRSGIAATSMNRIGQGESDAETEAFRTALGNTLNQRLTALNYRTGRQDSSGSQSQAAFGTSANAAAQRSQMGSTFGDIMGGVSDLAGLVVPAIGAGKAIYGAFNRPKKLGTTSTGVGGYSSFGGSGMVG